MQDIATVPFEDGSPTGIALSVGEAFSDLRCDLIERVLKALLADAERSEGDLRRADIDRAYLRRNLTIPECGWVEKQLGTTEIRIIDDEEIEDSPAATGSNSQKRRLFLTEMEERELGRKIQLARRIRESNEPADTEFAVRALMDAERAKSRFVETNIRYVHKLARQKRFLRHFSADDLFQEGIMGLLRATDLYDPELGFRFKTYATWWIQQYMHRALDDGDRTIRLPVHLQENVRRIRSKRAKLALEIGREPTLPELANHIGVDKERRTVGQGTTSRCIWITAQFEGLRCAARWAAAA